MENERIRIKLDSPENTYFGGQSVTGEICLNLTKRTKIRAIKVQIAGKGKCKWMEILRKETLTETTSSLFYSNKENYVFSEVPISFFEPRGVELGVGEYLFGFSIPLSTSLPSSFKGSYGSIKYKLRIIIQKPWTFDEKHSILLTVVKRMILSPTDRMNPKPLTKQTTRTICLFGNRPVSLVAVLPEDFAIRNENLKLYVTVTNNSNTNVEKLKFSIHQIITYWSLVPSCTQKREIITIFSKETGCVQKKTERSFAHELPVPACQPTDSEFSRIMNISYEVRVDAVLRGFYKNLVLNLPFRVYSADSLPAENSSELSYPVGHQQESNTSICSSVGSPSHSSQYSESSSLHSTTSDSSASTLSPAVGSALPYTRHHNNSPQFNSPSARSSVRSSVVPYVHYQNTPHQTMMMNSYPPPHVPTSPYVNDLSATSSQYIMMNSSLHNQTPPQNPHQMQSCELPPSYEELFGNASAPPLK